MKVVGFAGYSGSGKTTLLEKLIPAMKARGLRVSGVKHAHHRFDVDQPGKDSWRHRKAGAFEVVVASAHRLALMREFEAPTELGVHALIGELHGDVDWVFVEGFKASNLPKIEIWRAVAGQPLRHPDDPLVLAVATDSPTELGPTENLTVLDINNADAVADFLVGQSARFVYSPGQRD